MAKAQISHITFYWDSNYVCYNNSDIQTDYFNNYSLTLKAAIEWIKEDGADTITTRTVNNDSSIPTLKRIKRICKAAGYTFTDTSAIHHYSLQNVDEFCITYELNKIHPSTFVILWNDGSDEDFFKSAPMDERNKNIFLEDLKNQGIKKIMVKEFKE